MRALLLLSGLLGVTLAADEPAADDTKSIQGTWVLTGLEVNGKPIGDSVRGVGLKVHIKGGEITFQNKEGMDKGKDKPPTGTFKIDPNKTPKTIDTTYNKESVEQGIYSLEGDGTLKLCVAKVGGKRPSEFKTKEGDGTRLFIFKREGDLGKDKEKDKDKAKDK